MSNFNFTSQICTTKEQSERLLALGLKRETADMVYKPHSHYTDEVINYYEPTPMVEPLRKYIIADDIDFLYYIPAWSLHRLIEILDIWCLELNFNEFNNVYDQVISYFEERVKGGFFNKKYLKEL